MRGVRDGYVEMRECEGEGRVKDKGVESHCELDGVLRLIWVWGSEWRE